MRFFKQLAIVKFKGIDNINDIERYKGCSLYVTREDAIPLEEDEYYIADLQGMQMYTEDGELFGTPAMDGDRCERRLYCRFERARRGSDSGDP